MEGTSSKPEIDHGDEFLEIILRLFDPSDVDNSMVWALDDRVRQFCTWDTYTSKEQAIDFIQNNAIPHPWIRTICLKNRAIGSVSVTLSSSIGKNRSKLSYALGSEYWGRGIITMVVKMVVSTVFGEWPESERIEAMVVAENLGSRRVLEKVGFHKEGVLRKYVFLTGKTRDLVMFSLLCSDLHH